MRIAIALLATILVHEAPYASAADMDLLLIPDDSLPGVGVPAHDPNCVNPFSAIGGPFLVTLGEIPASLMDDLHLTTTTNAALCAFTFTARNFDAAPRTITVNFRSGGAADPVPGAVTAGPFVVAIDPGSTASYHVETGSGYVTPDAYIEFLWDTTDLIVIRTASGTTVGTSHDTWYQDPPGQFYGDATDPGNFYVQVFVSPPVPTESSTWGAVKAAYR